MDITARATRPGFATSAGTSPREDEGHQIERGILDADPKNYGWTNFRGLVK